MQLKHNLITHIFEKKNGFSKYDIFIDNKTLMGL